MGKKSEALTPKQARFVDEYLKDLDATAAYRRAGYKAKSASAIWSGACAILRNAKVKAVLAERRVAIERRTEISQDRVRLELGRIDPRGLFDERGQFVPVPKLSADTAAAISSIEITTKDGELVTTKVRPCSKVEALDRLCRHLGMYEDKMGIVGLERELAAMSDEEIEGRLIELELGDYERVNGDHGSASSATAAPSLPAPSRAKATG